MKSIGREIVRLCFVVTILFSDVLLGQSDSSELAGSTYDSLWQWLMQKDDTIHFLDKLWRVQQVYDSIDRIEIAIYNSIYRAELDSLGDCEREVE